MTDSVADVDVVGVIESDGVEDRDGVSEVVGDTVVDGVTELVVDEVIVGVTEMDGVTVGRSMVHASTTSALNLEIRTILFPG